MAAAASLKLVGAVERVLLFYPRLARVQLPGQQSMIQVEAAGVGLARMERGMESGLMTLQESTRVLGFGWMPLDSCRWSW